MRQVETVMAYYEHTQKAPLHWGLNALAIGLLVLAWTSRNEQQASFMVLGVAALLMLAGLMFQRLTIRDDGEALAVRYGPLSVFRTRIPFSQIRSVETSRTSWIDGWGVHWIPGRGTTYNLWGLDCVKLDIGGRVVRLGSDDAANLTEFLKQRISQVDARGERDG